MNYSRRQLEALGETLGECVTRKEGGRVIYGGGGSGGGGGGTSTQVSDLPEWAKPYAKETLGKASALTDISQNPYQTYGGERIAGFQPIQQKAQEAAYNMGTAGQLGTGTGLATAAGLMGLGASYQPGVFRNQFRAPEAYQPSQFAMLQAEAPDLQQFQMGPAERVYGGQYGAPMMETAQTGYRPDLQMFQMAGPERVRTGSFTRPGTAAQYMSPYIEQALAPQLREAQRASDILGTQQAGQAVQQGAFGGSRAALLEAERQRNLATQMGDIRARGLQSAYEQAQQLYGTEAQRQLAAQQANQQAMLQAGGQNLQAALGVQQLGAQTGLQTALANLSAQQQANVQNQAAQLQAQGLTAQQAMQAALANQQAGLTTGQQNLAALLGVQQLGAGQSMQAQLANQQALQAAQQAAEQSRQFGYGQGMTAAQQRAQFGQAAQQLGEQSRQYGAGYGLQGLGTALQAAGQLGQLGQTEFGQAMDINRLQQQVGAQQQALEQQRLGQSYQDFLNQQRYPYQQLEFMSNMLRGTPMGTVQTMYQPPGSTLGQLAGLGIGLGGMAQFGKMFNEGGRVDGYADGGSVTSDYKVDEILSNLSDAQLQQARVAALNSRDMRRVEAIDEELAERTSLRSGLGNAFNSLPQETQESVTEMATGGIVAFDEGGRVERYSDGGTMAGFFTSPEAMAMDELRVQDELRRRAEEARYTALAEGREPTPAPQQAKPAHQAPKPAPQTAPQAAPQAAPAATPPRAARQPAVTRRDASEAVKTISEAARVQIPKDETRELTKSLFDELMGKSSAQQEEFKKELESAKNRAKEIEARGVGEAMMKFGFTMAAAAAKPGAGRGLSGALKSAAAASPAFAESMAENAKLKQAAEDNYMKLRMENARYQTAVEQGNMQLAANLANNINQRKLTQASLEQQISQQDRMFGIEKEKLGILRQQSGRPGSALEMAYNVLSRDPKNAGKSETDLLEMAAKSVGAASSYRTDTSALVQAEKLKEELLEKRRLFSLSDSKSAKEQVRLIDDRIRQIDATLGSKGGVGSGSASQVLRFDSKGNPIQ
jgi:hypothetical protein